ncbi:hypothetical protein [Flavobacterium sp.]|uniref:hypothetical protein n=1 Tax=Flavobacterium sp. TaxID=239 RepID=UPI0039E639E1
MRKRTTLTNCVIIFLFPLLAWAQVGLNTTTPNAMLDVSSSNNGMLIPRVSLGSATDVATVINPQGGALAISTLVYNSATAGVSPNNVTPGFYYWDGSRWVAISGTKDWTLNGNSGTVQPATPATYGTSAIAATENFIGTTDARDVVLGSANIERMRVSNTTGNIGIGTAAPTGGKLHVNNPAAGGISNYSESTFAGNADGIGVVGTSVNAPGYGYGGQFTGGYRGIVVSNPATNYNSTTYGLQSYSTGTTGVGSRIAGYFSASGAANNYGLIVPPAGGNVGFGTNAPDLAKLQVEGMIGNTSAIFKGAANSQGIAMIADWPAIHFNSYFNGSIRSMSNGGYASIINTDQASGGIMFQTTNVANTTAGNAVTVPERMRITGAGNVGIGTTAPTNTLHVNGSFRLVDGTQGLNKVLTSSATGVASWQSPAIDNVVGVLGGAGATIPYNQGPYLQTGAYIILPPGKFAVNVTMLLSKAVLTYSPNNSFFWVRSTFSNSGGLNPTPSPDIVGSNLASGNFPGTSVYALLTGTIIINNTSGTNRTYFYVAGSVVSTNTTETLSGFGGSVWAENNIIAYRLSN